MKNWYFVKPDKEESVGPITLGELLVNATVETLVWKEDSLKDWVAAKDHPELIEFQEVLLKNDQSSLKAHNFESSSKNLVPDEMYSIVIKAELENKLHAVKVLQTLFSFSLVEAAKLVESVPAIIQSGLSKQDATSLCDQLNSQGVHVEMEVENGASMQGFNSASQEPVSVIRKDNFILELPTLVAFSRIIGWRKSELKYSIYQDGLHLGTLDAFNETDHILKLNVNNSKSILRIELIGIIRYRFLGVKEYPFKYSQEIEFDQINFNQVTKVILKPKSDNVLDFLINLKTVEPTIEFQVFLRDDNYIEI